jgi:Putative auto-transporter adhesin, head GIN domain
MAVVSRPGHHRRAPRLRVGLAAVVGVAAVAAIVVLVDLAVRSDGDSTHGSGVTATEYRELAPFAAVELAGANTVTVRVGPAQSVAVTADDDLVDQVTTTVRSGRLFIANDGSFTTEAPMRVAVSVPSLDGVTLSGTGTVIVEGVTGTDFVADLSGTGTLAASGTVDRLTAVLSDTGTVELQGLVAQDVIARLEGTGDINVHATSTLDATLTGTGSIVYFGSPSVTTHNTGTGSITGE